MSFNYITKQDKTKELFYKCLEEFEADLVRRLCDELKIEIIKPKKGISDEIIGEEAVKIAIANQVKMFERKERIQAAKYGIKPKKGILLYGPPGNGKSKLAEVSANKHSLYFMKITSDTFTKVSLNEQNNTLIRIFNGAFQLSEMCGDHIKGVLLFFDEFDSLASSELLDYRVRGTMLTQLDDEKTLRNPSSKVLFMAATNFYERLDEAMIRAGRIDEKIEMKNPTEENAIKMLMLFTSKEKVEALDNEKAQRAYEAFSEKIKEEKVEQFILKSSMQWSLLGKTEEELRNMAIKVNSDVRPSVAELKDYVEKLIATAYYDLSFTDTDEKKILISEDIIMKVCG